jgi:hypothetical protein
MLIQSPIFINSFSRGGSNMFWNIFLTHPDVCSPIWETLEIFRVGIIRPTWEGHCAALLSGHWHLFDQRNLCPRPPITKSAQAFIDQTFFKWKLRTFADIDMKYKCDNVTYTLDEVKHARLAAKNNNGLAFLSDILLEMYPDAHFFALVRHPLALYESYRRHKFIQSVEGFIDFYQRLGGKMVQDAHRVPNYHLIKFEEMVDAPVATAQKVYDLAGLDFQKINKMRFKAKAYFNKKGEYTTGEQYTVGRHYWFDFDKVGDFVEPGINQHQIERLSKSEVDEIMHRIGNIAEVFGYTEQLAVL